MAGKLSEELKKNTEQQKDLYREQYYANHGYYPPEETGCLVGILMLLFTPVKWIFTGTIWCFKWIFKGIVWCFKWMFKGITYGFKGLFYTFPKFLWSKGTAGKIAFGSYIFVWCTVIFIECMGTNYIFRNWLYFSIILFIIIATAATTITFRLLKKKFSRHSIISLFSGVFLLIVLLIIGIFLTKSLVPLSGEIEPIVSKSINNEIQHEEVEGD